MKKFAALILSAVLLCQTVPSFSADYDPQHTMLALNMAIVSVHRILTTQSRAVLEEEYTNIINNLSLGNIESDRDMTELYRDMLAIISRKRISEGDSKRLRSYYDAAEQRRITYALSNIRMTEARIKAHQHEVAGLEAVSRAVAEAIRHNIEGIERETEAKVRAAKNDIAGIERETQAQLRSSQSRMNDARSDISDIKRAQNAIVRSWLGNMAVYCMSSFLGNPFSVKSLIFDSAVAYAEYDDLAEKRASAERTYRHLQAEHGEIQAMQASRRQRAADELALTEITQANRRQQAQDDLAVTEARNARLRQQRQDKLEQERVRLSNLKAEMKQDEAMLKEELQNSLWRLERQDIADCNALQERLLQSSWNLLRQYRLPDSYRLTQTSLNNFYRAVKEEDITRRSRMLRNLEDEFRVYPPYWYYRAKTAQEAGKLTEAREHFAKFSEVWRPVLRRDPYKLEAAKFRIQELASAGKELDDIKPELLELLETVYSNTPKDDWADNLFLGVAYFLLGERDKGMDCIAVNLDFGYEEKISGMLFKQMEKGSLDSEEAQDVVRRMKLSDLITSMNIADNESAMALSLYFEGNAEALEGLAKTSGNPIVFHALRLMEQSKGGGQDYGRVLEFLRRHDALKDKVGSAYTEIVPLVKKYSDEGRESAKVLMADMLMYGLGVEQDRQKAEAMFTELAENGNIYAQFMMIQSRFATVAPAPKKEPALTPQQAEALYQEGQKYYRKSYYEEAVECYLQAAAVGHAEAQYMLGLCYRYGWGVSQDLRKAREWFGKAREWYEKAAAQGHSLARERLAEMNRKGL